MSHDISQSVSQRVNGAYDEENRRIQEVSDELQRLCRLHEEESGNGKANGGRFEIEQRVAEQYAKEHGMWILMDNVFDLGIPGPSGNENDTYVAKDTIYKVNNLLNSGGICKLLDKILLHNLIFPNTAYRLHGFTGYDGRTIMPVLEQERICESQPATQIMIDPGTQNQEASSYCLSKVGLPDLPTISSMSSVLITKASRCWNLRISERKYAII